MAIVDAGVTGRGRTRKAAAPRQRATATTASPEARLLEALIAAKAGDFSMRLDPDHDGIDREVAIAFNEFVEANDLMASEISRVAKLVGRDGRINERASLPQSAGAWKASTEAINDLIDSLVRPTAEFARVIDAVARGDLSQKMALRIEGQPVKGEFLRIRTTVNAMVDHRVDRVLELEHLAADVDGDLLRQVAVRDRRRHLGDVPHLIGEVRGHEVHVLRQVLPHAGDALHLGLAAELALGADLAGDAGDLGGEGAELVLSLIHI